VTESLPDLLAWLQPRALLLALALPPVIRVVGHWLPEEVFMVAIGVLAAQAGSPAAAAVLLAAVVLSHFVSDQAVFLGGRWLRPRLARFPRIESRLALVTGRLASSPAALLGLIPARVLPLGRGAWLAGCGVVGIPWRRFAAVDLAALLVHLATWSGLGWWLATDLGRLAASTEVGKVVGVWLGVGLVAVLGVVAVWRSRPYWLPVGSRAIRRVGSTRLDTGRTPRRDA
jgi:membrane protein DedA with SNARE-associated domain